jgi:glycosyltransferase involved in cell wall biosynthesis
MPAPAPWTTDAPIAGRDPRYRHVLHLGDAAYVGSSLASALGCSFWRRPRGKSAGLRLVADAPRLLRGYRLVHAHYGLWPLFAAWRSGVPYVAHLHGSDVRSDPRRYPLVLRLQRRAIAGAAAVFASTPDIAAPASALYGREVEWVPNPVDASLFRPLRLEKECDVFVPVRRKSVDVGADRWACLEDGAAVGAALRAFLSARPELSVRYGGGIPHDEMPRAYNVARVVIGGMDYDALGVCDLEAMACGAPVCCRDSYEGSPHVERPEDVAALLASSAERERLGREGCEFVLRTHELRRVAERWRAVYDGLLG